MKTVIYLDVLLLVNFIMGYFLLRSAAALTAARIRNRRLFLGALAAAASSVVLLAPPLPVWMQVGYQLGTALLVVRCAFGWCGWLQLFRQALWYALLNLLVAGMVILAAQHWGVSCVETNNLAVYFNLSPVTLMLAALSVYFCIHLGVLLFGQPPPPLGWELTLSMQEGSIRIQGYLDTGFLVQDPMTGTAVILLSWPQVKTKFPEKLVQCLDAYFEGLNPVFPEGLSFRLIPCRTVAGDKILPGICCRRVRATQSRQCFISGETTLAFTQQTLRAGEYDALFGRDFLSGCTKRKKEGCIKC